MELANTALTMKIAFQIFFFANLIVAQAQAKEPVSCRTAFRQSTLQLAMAKRPEGVQLHGTDTLTGEKFLLNLEAGYLRTERWGISTIRFASNNYVIDQGLRAIHGNRKKFYINIELETGDFVRVKTIGKDSFNRPIDEVDFVTSEDVNPSDLLYRHGREKPEFKNRMDLVEQQIDQIYERSTGYFRQVLLEYRDLVQKLVVDRKILAQDLNPDQVFMARNVDTGDYYGFLLRLHEPGKSFILSKKSFWSGPKVIAYKDTKNQPVYALSNGRFISHVPLTRDGGYTIDVMIFTTIEHTRKSAIRSFLF